MTELQERLYMLLCELDTICKKHGITYYLDGGSALGAVRHEGFIPWDDDIDLVFTRKNWEKFVAVIDDELPEGRRLESLERNERYTMVYARYCDVTTSNVLISSMLDIFESGLFIDLFIMDPAPNDPDERREFVRTLQGYTEYLNPYYYDMVCGANEWYDFFTEMGNAKGRDAVIEWMNENLFCFDEGGRTHYVFRCDIVNFEYEIADFGEPRMLTFERGLFPVPGRVENYLRTHYGDNWYMMPSQREQVGHNVVINLDVPYKEYRDDYMRFINYGEALNVYKKLHDRRVKTRMLLDSMEAEDCRLAAEACRLIYDSRLRSGWKPLEQLERGELDSLSESLDDYVSKQTSKQFLLHRILVHTDESVTASALVMLTLTDRYPLARRLWNARRSLGEAPVTAALIDAGRLVDGLIEMTRLMERREFEAAKEIQAVWFPKYPTAQYLRRAVLYTEFALNGIPAPDSEAERLLIESQTEMPCEDYDVMWADVLLDRGMSDEARAIYEAVKKATSNGLLLLHAEKRLAAMAEYDEQPSHM